jgi:hypothetical protein
VQAIIVGTGGQFLIRLGPPNEWDGQRDRQGLRGAEDGTMVRVVYSCIIKGVTCGVYLWTNGKDGESGFCESLGFVVCV